MTKKIIATNGYVTLFIPKHHLAMRNGYVYEHRLVAENKLGRPLLGDEQIHHVDGNKLNNDPDNLEIITDLEHRVRHRKTKGLKMPDESNSLIRCLCGCGDWFYKFDNSGRPRKYKNGHNKNTSNIKGINHGKH
jgi:hypothetical protein